MLGGLYPSDIYIILNLLQFSTKLSTGKFAQDQYSGVYFIYKYPAGLYLYTVGYFLRELFYLTC